MRGISVILRRLVRTGPSITSRASSSSSSSSLVISSAAAAISYSTVALPDLPKPFFDNYTLAPSLSFNLQTNPRLHLHSRSYSSPSSSGPSNVVVIESEEQFNDSLRKAQDEDLPAIFYFTAVWCGPCRLLSPIIGQLSEKYPHVTTYKIDIDKEGLGSALRNLDIHAVPTLYFFQKGKKASEIVGADIQRLRDTMEKLYKSE